MGHGLLRRPPVELAAEHVVRLRRILRPRIARFGVHRRLHATDRLHAVDGSDHSSAYFDAAADLARAVDRGAVDAMARGLAGVRERGGRLFILGVGGGAGHASHAVNDFRKLCRIESYAPTDNVSELTARTNDDGWETSLQRLAGGLAPGRAATRCSCSRSAAARASTTCPPTSCGAMEAAREAGAAIYGVVGAPGGTLAELATWRS